MFRSFCLNSILILGLAGGLLGQHQMGHAAPKTAGGAAAGPGSGKNRRNLIDTWDRMSPEERQKALAKLPPERRKKIEEQLNQYKNLTPSEKRDLRSRYQGFNQLSPEKQSQARRVYQQFGKLPADRQGTVRSEFENLRSMPEAERTSRLNSEDFRSKYNNNEQGILRNFSGLLTPSK
jgi:hypothetical protein